MNTVEFYDEARNLVFVAKAKRLNDVRGLLGNRYTAVLVRYKRRIYTASDIYAGRSG